MIASGITFFAIAILVVDLLMPIATQPLLTAAVLIGGGVYVWRLNEIRRVSAGLRGEQHVGEKLEAMERTGARVIHDLQGDGFNVDHLLITRAGVFVIETKFLSKPIAGDKKLHYDGTKVLLRGAPLMKDAVAQVTRAAMSVAEIVKTVEAKCPVRPVVLYPGWFVTGTPLKADGAWVLNENLFVMKIGDAAEVLNDAAVGRIHHQLAILLEKPARLT